jgi:hypothetical protein
MIKIKLYELDKHRNECTFRPFLHARNSLHDIGIEFTTGASYDYAWIAQASFLDKKVSLSQSVDMGLEFLSKITGEYMLIDGQDSTSLIGAYEVFKQSKALFLLKNSLLKDRNLYKQGWHLGRHYWGPGDYKLDDFDLYKDRILLSGGNWIATHWAGVPHTWYNENRIRQYDVSAMFQYPSLKLNYEHDELQSSHYDKFRAKAIDQINKLQCKVTKLENGVRLSQSDYYNKMYESKIIVAPYGYGEMAPRDLEAIIFGNLLIKPDMSVVDTAPNIFIDGETYIACKHDFSDLIEKIEYILDNTEQYYYIIQNARKIVTEELHPNKLAMHLYDVFVSMKNVVTDEQKIF